MSKNDHSKLWGSSTEDAFPVKRKITLPKACGFEIEMAKGLHRENKISGVLGDDLEIPISLDRSNNGIQNTRLTCTYCPARDFTLNIIVVRYPFIHDKLIFRKLSVSLC